LDTTKTLRSITLDFIEHVHQQPRGKRSFSIEYSVGLTYNPDQSLPKSRERLCARSARQNSQSFRTAKAIVPSVIWARTVPIPASPYRFFRSMFDSNRRHCRRYYGIDCQGDRDLALCICNFPLGYSPGTLYRKCFTGMLASGPSHSAYKWLIVVEL
jgi:hypothetical protein